MDVSFFSARPSVLLRLQIKRVLAQIRGGVHRSRVGGDGLEFRTFRPWAPGDSPSRINYPASFKASPDLDELVVRATYGEKRISIIAIVDARKTMMSPSEKLLHVGSLFWLFALSAFQELDRFRAVFIFDGALVDSGWISKESKLEEFLDQDITEHRTHASFLREQNPISLLVDERLHDALLVVFSDFCASWEKEITALPLLGAEENNIRSIFCAMDEWAGATSLGYSITIRDPRTGAIRLMTDADIKETAHVVDKSFLCLSRELDQHAASFVRIPLIHDPITSFCRAALGLEIEAE